MFPRGRMPNGFGNQYWPHHPLTGRKLANLFDFLRRVSNNGANLQWWNCLRLSRVLCDHMNGDQESRQSAGQRRHGRNRGQCRWVESKLSQT
ncbi:hypothetical protein VFPPC_15146 [Pochonia chlamydosporia 170]|uniref:Uncharacterized protein n=1 Tax=Pochonia chlamydosporia 170 TaxID=1380566 RepID=A0A179G3N7_METCM|nr:hypothetical protein VFPPC_15146 [Pochonia chlamydosporia 170]OAQ72485.1 hypothetical protein VFPPC_15146 [Pochonia chlamydosporia 170]